METPTVNEHTPQTEQPIRAERRVSLQTVARLSVYRRVLEELHQDGLEHVYSQQLAELVGVTPAQLRRDLASFGSFGNVARGYHVAQMAQTISRILGTDSLQQVALVGVGDLGRSLLSYRGFEERGFRIEVCFDVDPQKIGRVFAGRRCYPLEAIEQVVSEVGIKMVVLACRPKGIQELVDRFARAGVTGFLNFVPKRVRAPVACHVEDIDIAARLEKLSFISHMPGGDEGEA